MVFLTRASETNRTMVDNDHAHDDKGTDDNGVGNDIGLVLAMRMMMTVMMAPTNCDHGPDMS